MYKKILVTIDCSTVDDVIVDHVAELAEIHESSVFLIHAIHAHTRDEDQALNNRAREHLERHATTLAKRGIEAQIIVRNGEPYPVISAEVASGQYDLVAMATHGHGAIGDFLYGSVSDKLKHAIEIPLLLIKA
jgi:universal stress protein A